MSDPDDAQVEAPAGPPGRGGARRKPDYIALTKAARARFDTLAAESIEAVFQAVLTAATQDGDMAAAKLLIDRVIPSRRGVTSSSMRVMPACSPKNSGWILSAVFEGRSSLLPFA